MRCCTSGRVLTSLEVLDLVEGLALLLVSLLELGDLDLLSELLEVAQLAGLLGSLLVGCLLDELGLDLLHVGILLDHLGEVVLGTREGNALLTEELAGCASGLKTLGVKGKLSLEIVLDVGDGFGCGVAGDERLVCREGNSLVCGNRNAVQGGEKGGCVVNGKSLVRNDIFLILVVEIFKVAHGDIIGFRIFLLIIVLFSCRLGRLLSRQLCDLTLLEGIPLWLANNLLFKLD